MDADFAEMVRYASKAPSGHNTQPWKFHILHDAITIVPDLEVALPVVDRDNRELFVSLGCAAENLCIAAGHFGYQTEMEGNEQGIIVELRKSPDVIEDNLFGQIVKRQTNRSVYNGEKIPREILKGFPLAGKESGVRFYLAQIGTPVADTIAEYIVKGNDVQMNDVGFKKELLSWMRFNDKGIKDTQNGLSYRVFGNPPLPDVFAKPIVNLFLKPRVQNKSDRKKINSSSHFVVWTTRHNSPEEWIGLGRMLQRFLLKASEAGIACAFLNQPCEVALLASALQKILPVHREYPTIILRIGYAGPLPYSPRKGLEALLI